MINKHWVRWIKASINDFMNQQNRADGKLKVSPVPMYFEGQNREGIPNTFIECRVDGPEINELTKGCFRFDCEINHIVTVVKDDQDLYAYERVIGMVTAMHQNIQIFKRGDGPDDDDTFLFCLLLKPPVETLQFGQVDEKTRVSQASITGIYYGYLQV